MKNFILIIGAFLIILKVSLSSANIIYSGVRNISFTATEPNTIYNLTIDLADDKTSTWDNIQFDLAFNSNQITGVQTSWAGSPSALAYETNYPFIEKYSFGEEMIGQFLSGSALLFRFHYTTGSEGFFQNTTGYAGLLLGDYGDQHYFGWMQLSVENFDPGNEALSPTITIIDWAYSTEPGMPIRIGFKPEESLWVPIETESDDAEENLSDGDISLTSSDLELTQDGSKPQKVGLRFHLNIPAGATILNAAIQFTADETNSEPTSLSVAAEATSNALTFSNTGFNISNRILTVANVPWTPPAWTLKGESGADQQTPDLSAVVQEIVEQDSWEQGNYIAFIISGEGLREAESFDGSAPPVLHVTYSTSPLIPQQPVAENDGTSTVPAYRSGVNQPLVVPNGLDDIVERNDFVGYPIAEVSGFDPVSYEGGEVTVNPDGSFSYTPLEDYVGIDSFSYRLSNTEGVSEARVYIKVVDVTTLWISLGNKADDAEENLADGDISLTSSDLEFIQDGSKLQKVGLRFALEVPPGATIEHAYIQYTTDEVASETTVLTVHGEATENALMFSDTKFNVSNRALTTAQVAWMPLPWITRGEAGPDQATPDLSIIVQEVVNQAGWMQGNAIAFITSGSGKRVAESFDGTAPPVLHVSFSTETTKLWIPVSMGTDDAEEDSDSGDMYLRSSDLELIQDGSSKQIIGIRFQGINVPSGAVIESASIQFTTDEESSEQTVLIVSGEASADALAFKDMDFNISDRTLTTTKIQWTPAPWLTRGLTGPEQATPDLSAIVQEVVGQETWIEGNSIAFIISGDGNRVAESFDGTAAPVLHLEYSIPLPQNNAPTATGLSITDTNGDLLVVGDSLTGSYTYSDVENDSEGASSFRWLRNGVEIADVTTPTYTTVAEDVRSAITFEVTPIATTGTSPGTPITSSVVIVLLQIADDEFQLGGMGPAGGTVVFIGDGDGFVGMQGLEIAPEDQGTAPWGCRFLLIAGADGHNIGTGAQNTADILSGCPESGIAAELADQYTLNGFDDWFLPSQSELFLVSEPDRRPYLPDLNFDRDLYWTSTGQDNDDSEWAWTLKVFSGSEEGDWQRDNLFNVRAMRAFPATTPPNSRPTVTNVSITDNNGDLLVVGDVLTGNYTYNDPESDIEGASTFRWLRNGVAIAGATSTSYITVAADETTSLTFEVTPIATSGSSPGTTMISSSVFVLLEIGNSDFQVGGRGPAGGIMIYISDGDGVVGTQGLEMATEHQGTAPWGCESLSITGADETAVGTGAQNTADILAGCTETGTAAAIADSYSLNGFEDWFLPSQDELNLLSENHFVISAFPSTFWSSSEENDTRARIIRYINIDHSWELYQLQKSKEFIVLPIRAFSTVNPQ